MKRLLAFVAIVSFSANCFAERCLAVNGLQFEAVDYGQLLVIRDGKNIGILSVSYFGSDLRKASSLQFRFFTPTICDGIQNNKFHINQVLVTVSLFSPFK